MARGAGAHRFQMLQTLRKTGEKFSSKTGRVGEKHQILQISRKTPTYVIPNFEGLKMKKTNWG